MHCISNILQNVKDGQRVNALKLKINQDIVICGLIVHQWCFTCIISLKRDNFTKAREREAEGRGTRERNGKK